MRHASVARAVGCKVSMQIIREWATSSLPVARQNQDISTPRLRIPGMASMTLRSASPNSFDLSTAFTVKRWRRLEVLYAGAP
jgi:hypothetical protein